MKRIPILIAEDEPPQRGELRALLGELAPDFEIAVECDDGLAALEGIDAYRPQIVFLDIRMPGANGLEVARAASGRAHVIFTTAYDEYAVKAFEAGAVDYLLKPIKRDRLALAIERVRERLRSGLVPDISALIATLENQIASRERRDGIKWITASVGSTTKMFSIDEVLFFQAQDKYTRVVTATEESIIRTTLKELLAGLDSNSFWQIHRSTIVRVAAIQSVQRNEDGRVSLRLKGCQETLPVSGAFLFRFRGM